MSSPKSSADQDHPSGAATCLRTKPSQELLGCGLGGTLGFAFQGGDLGGAFIGGVLGAAVLSGVLGAASAGSLAVELVISSR